MESRKIVTSPAQEDLVKVDPDDFGSPTSTSGSVSGGTQSVDETAQAKPPVCSYPVSPKGNGCESGERH